MDTHVKVVPFNRIQGIASSNVPAHSNEFDDYISFDGCYVHGIYTGYKWQCVEFARRWLLLRKSCIFQSFAAAADMWEELKYVERVTDGRKFSMKIHRNGSSSKPSCDSFLLYPRGEDIPFGHIAVICEVHEQSLRVVEQNYRFHYWSDNHSREIPMVKRDGLYWIEDYYPVYGWMEIEQSEELTPLNPSREPILDRYRAWKSMGTFECCVSSSNEIYCKVDEDFLLNLSRISNELYQLFRQTTENIIWNEQLLNGFGIPKIFWSRIRRSWVEESQFDLLNYLPLKFDGKKVQICYYKIDDVCYTLESLCQQTEKVRSMDVAHDFTSTFQLHRLLVRNWKRLNIQTMIHLLVEEKNDREIELVLYMEKVMIEAGIKTKVCRFPEEFFWKNSDIVDRDGERVEIVWKVWNWEMIFENYSHRYDEKENSWPNDRHPTLNDILFHSNIRILEPIWKSILNHSLLLPVLCTMYPSHPNILPNQQWIVSEDSRQLPSFINNCNRQTDHYSDKTIVSWIINGFFSGFTVHDDDNHSSTYCCVV